MKLLLDECTPRSLKREFAGFDISTVEDAGFKGLKNGKLLAAASGHYDVLITVDRNLSREQKTTSFDIAVLVLIAKSNRYEDLKPLTSRALDVLTSIKTGESVEIKNN